LPGQFNYRDSALDTLHVSERVRRIKPSPSTAAADRANQLRREGRSIVNLVVGEPDFDTPRHIRQAAARAMEDGATRYTALAGTLELRQAIAEKLARENGLAYDPGEIIVANGAKSAIYSALAATLEPGDEVVIPAPYWVSYPDMVLLGGGTPVPVTCPEQTGFKLQPEELEAAITPRTKWVVLNSPNNPTGAAYTEAELRALTDVLVRHPHVWVMTDDMYEHLVYDGFRFSTPAQIEPSLKSRTLTVNGVSKSFAMTGWRIGYAGGPKELIGAIAIIQSQSTTNPCSISQAASVVALNSPLDFLEERNATYKSRRDLVVDMLNEAPGLRCHRPEGAFYVYPNCAGVIGRHTPRGTDIRTSEDFGRALLAEAGVAVVHGSAFGLDPYFRISYATSTAQLEEACHRIIRFCERLTN
jgi:aspartate aminotransferase